MARLGGREDPRTNAWRDRRPHEWLAVVVLVLAGLPLVVLAAKAHRQGWQPMGDNAVIVARAHDVFSVHTPRQGMPSAVFSWSGGQADPRHPGPTIFWVFAPAVLVLGTSSAAPLATAAAVNIGALVLAGMFARRTVGPTGSVVLLWLVVLAIVASDAPIFQPLNPTLAAIPLLAAIVCSWAATTGDRWAWPALAATATFVAQADLAYLLPAAFLVAVPAAVLVGRWWSDRRAGRPAASAPWSRPWVVLTGAILAVGWAIPAAEWVVHRGGNLRELWRASWLDLPTHGWQYAADALGAVLRPGSLALTYGPFDRGLDGAALVAAGLSAIAFVLGFRTGSRAVRWLIAYAVGLAAVVAVSQARVPVAATPDVKYLRPVAVASVFWSFAVCWSAAAWLAGVAHRRRPEARRLLGGLGSAALAASFLVLLLVPVQRPLDLSGDFESAHYGVSAALAPAIGDEVGGRSFRMVPVGGPRAVAVLESVVSRLLIEGADARVDAGLARYFGPFHRADDHPAATGPVLYLVYHGQAPPVAGSRLVARWTPPGYDPASVRVAEAELADAVRRDGVVRLAPSASDNFLASIVAATAGGARSPAAVGDDAFNRIGRSYTTRPRQLLEQPDATLAALVVQEVIEPPASLTRHEVGRLRQIVRNQPISVWLAPQPGGN